MEKALKGQGIILETKRPHFRIWMRFFSCLIIFTFFCQMTHLEYLLAEGEEASDGSGEGWDTGDSEESNDGNGSDSDEMGDMPWDYSPEGENSVYDGEYTDDGSGSDVEDLGPYDVNEETLVYDDSDEMGDMSWDYSPEGENSVYDDGYFDGPESGDYDYWTGTDNAVSQEADVASQELIDYQLNGDDTSIANVESLAYDNTDQGGVGENNAPEMVPTEGDLGLGAPEPQSPTQPQTAGVPVDYNPGGDLGEGDQTPSADILPAGTQPTALDLVAMGEEGDLLEQGLPEETYTETPAAAQVAAVPADEYADMGQTPPSDEPAELYFNETDDANQYVYNEKNQIAVDADLEFPPEELAGVAQPAALDLVAMGEEGDRLEQGLPEETYTETPAAAQVAAVPADEYADMGQTPPSDEPAELYFNETDDANQYVYNEKNQIAVDADLEFPPEELAGVVQPAATEETTNDLGRVDNDGNLIEEPETSTVEVDPYDYSTMGPEGDLLEQGLPEETYTETPVAPQVAAVPPVGPADTSAIGPAAQPAVTQEESPLSPPGVYDAENPGVVEEQPAEVAATPQAEEPPLAPEGYYPSEFDGNWPGQPAEVAATPQAETAVAPETATVENKPTAPSEEEGIDPNADYGQDSWKTPAAAPSEVKSTSTPEPTDLEGKAREIIDAAKGWYGKDEWAEAALRELNNKPEFRDARLNDPQLRQLILSEAEGAMGHDSEASQVAQPPVQTPAQPAAKAAGAQPSPGPELDLDAIGPAQPTRALGFLKEAIPPVGNVVALTPSLTAVQPPVQPITQPATAQNQVDISWEHPSSQQAPGGAVSQPAAAGAAAVKSGLAPGNTRPQVSDTQIPGLTPTPGVAGRLPGELPGLVGAPDTKPIVAGARGPSGEHYGTSQGALEWADKTAERILGDARATPGLGEHSGAMAARTAAAAGIAMGAPSAAISREAQALRGQGQEADKFAKHERTEADKAANPEKWQGMGDRSQIQSTADAMVKSFVESVGYGTAKELGPDTVAKLQRLRDVKDPLANQYIRDKLQFASPSLAALVPPITAGEPVAATAPIPGAVQPVAAAAGTPNTYASIYGPKNNPNDPLAPTHSRGYVPMPDVGGLTQTQMKELTQQITAAAGQDMIEKAQEWGRKYERAQNKLDVSEAYRHIIQDAEATYGRKWPEMAAKVAQFYTKTAEGLAADGSSYAAKYADIAKNLNFRASSETWHQFASPVAKQEPVSPITPGDSSEDMKFKVVGAAANKYLDRLEQIYSNPLERQQAIMLARSRGLDPNPSLEEDVGLKIALAEPRRQERRDYKPSAFFGSEAKDHAAEMAYMQYSKEVGTAVKQFGGTPYDPDQIRRPQTRVGRTEYATQTYGGAYNDTGAN